jgi:osmotically-inducible protein OsmY
MAERYEDQYRRDRGYRRDERGFVDRAGDEVRSWFGDDEAERRRQMDERERDHYYGSGGYPRGGSDRAPYADRYWDRPSWIRPFGNERNLGDRFPVEREWVDRTSSPEYPGTLRDRAWEDRNRAVGWFAGRGPRGYQRSDARINEDVCDRLCDSPEVDATDIDVRVTGGEVTLSGSVSDRDQKRRAEDLIEQVSGVREVHNTLRVAPGQDATPPVRTTSPGTAGVEQPGNVLGVSGAPDRTATTARR